MLKSIDVERQERLEMKVNHGTGAEKYFTECLRNINDSFDKKRIRETFEYAVSIRYQRTGGSTGAYLQHPLRVFSLTFHARPCLELDAYIVALLHNVFEVSMVNYSEIQERFNSRIANSIRILTIDRNRQHQKEYRREYYKQISESFIGVRIVKLMDKLDNLFLLCLNKNAEVRTSYLEEIEDFILPMCDLDLPEYSPYYRDLVIDCRRIGFLDEEKSIQRFAKIYS